MKDTADWRKKTQRRICMSYWSQPSIIQLRKVSFVIELRTSPSTGTKTGPQCSKCHEWGHMADICPSKGMTVTISERIQEKKDRQKY